MRIKIGSIYVRGTAGMVNSEIVDIAGIPLKIGQEVVCAVQSKAPLAIKNPFRRGTIVGWKQLGKEWAASIKLGDEPGEKTIHRVSGDYAVIYPEEQ